MKYAASAIFALSLAGGGALALAAPDHGSVGQSLAAKAKITMDQARSIALKAHPGEVTDAELEKESGGSGLRYSFDIKSSGKTFEVGVDAANGAVLENKAEGANPD
jgi:uncharacterized membrane protein YkoI